MNNAAIGRTTARRLLEQLGLLTMPLRAKKRRHKAKPAVDKAASATAEPSNALRRHI